MGAHSVVLELLQIPYEKVHFQTYCIGSKYKICYWFGLNKAADGIVIIIIITINSVVK